MTNETRGLPRAREIIDKIENSHTSGQDFTPVLAAMSLHATAIATVELASATQLAALVAVLRLDNAQDILLADEHNQIADTVRALLGLSTLEEAFGA